MSCTPNVYAVESRSRANVTSAPGDAKGIAARPLPDILTYCYASQMMYVAAGKDYDQAVDFAIEAFPELGEVGRDRICLEVRVMHGNLKTIEIGRSAWSLLVATLTRFDVLNVRVASPGPPKSASTPFVSAVEQIPDRDVLETGQGRQWYYDANSKGSQTNLATYGSQAPPYSSSLLQPQSYTTGVQVVVNVVTSKPSRGRHSPQPPARQHYRF